jgi:hypothetical protein
VFKTGRYRDGSRSCSPLAAETNINALHAKERLRAAESAGETGRVFWPRRVSHVVSG